MFSFFARFVVFAPVVTLVAMARSDLEKNEPAPDSRLISRVGVAVILRGAGAVAAFGMNVVFGRLLGVEGAGLYYMALSVTSIGSVIARLGLDPVLLRFIAAEVGAGESARGWSVFRTGVLAVTTMSLMLTAIVFVFAQKIAEGFFGSVDLVVPLRYLSPGIVTFSIMSIVAESLKGLKRIAPAMLVSGVIYPIVGIALAGPMVSAFGPSGATLSYVLATASAAGWGLWLIVRAYTDRASTPDFSLATMARSAFPLWITSIINRALIPWLPLMMMGYFGNADQAGVFGAATRLSNLISFFLVAVNSILAPKFSEMYATGQLNEIGALARRFAFYTGIATAPLFLLLLFRGDLVMNLFGPGFESGGKALSVLALGQLVSVLSGSVGYVLIMTGNERSVRNATSVGLAITLIVGWTAIPIFGVVGAATACASGLAATNLVMLAFTKKKLGFVTWFGLK